MYKFCTALSACLLFISAAKAQNPLPDFSVEDLGRNHIRIAWFNGFGDACVQLNVQRSYDSVRNFVTVFSTESPQLPQNGYVDNIPYSGRVYYHIFYVLEGGAYYFTKSKAAVSGFANEAILPTEDTTQLISIIFRNTILKQVVYRDYVRFRDSIMNFTRDSLFTLNQEEVLLKPFDPGNAWVPSMHIFTNRDGYVDIKLFDAKQKIYKVVFYNSYGKKVFAINQVTETELIIDKTNFIHAGWFNFDLYENDKLIETNRVLVQQDF